MSKKIRTYSHAKLGLALLLSLVTLFLTANFGQQSHAASKCSKKTARKEARKAKPSFFTKGDFVYMLTCADFTGDGQTDMAFVRGVQGSAGEIGWVIFNQNADGSWKLVLYRPNDYKVGIEAKDTDIQSSTPIYKSNDPNCCPSGGTKVRLWRWNVDRYRLVETKVEK